MKPKLLEAISDGDITIRLFLANDALLALVDKLVGKVQAEDITSESEECSKNKI